MKTQPLFIFNEVIQPTTTLFIYIFILKMFYASSSVAAQTTLRYRPNTARIDVFIASVYAVFISAPARLRCTLAGFNAAAA